MRLQERRRASSMVRVLAATVALWFVVGGVLGHRHEAEVVHVVDHTTGALLHAQRVSHHDRGSTRAHFHGAAQDDGDLGACALSTALHQPVSATIARPIIGHVSARALGLRVLDAPRIAALASIYRLAPKTSPPVA